MVNRAKLQPFPEALLADALWRSLPRRAECQAVKVVASADGNFFWFGGFAGLVEAGPVTVRVARGAPHEAQIRRAMWVEAISAEGLARDVLPVWAELVQCALPADILGAMFPSGLGPVALASQFGICRQTAARYLRGYDG
ncbi:hypothetical protein [Thioclava kandeliae]|uniref:Helix-turn-helix domain-containing protein n=1 Tax=Thioclava kandeliae TaxID=3070818 RepID=A0ABV1SMC5_9RHOB